MFCCSDILVLPFLFNSWYNEQPIDPYMRSTCDAPLNRYWKIKSIRVSFRQGTTNLSNSSLVILIFWLFCLWTVVVTGVHDNSSNTQNALSVFFGFSRLLSSLNWKHCWVDELIQFGRLFSGESQLLVHTSKNGLSDNKIVSLSNLIMWLSILLFLETSLFSSIPVSSTGGSLFEVRGIAPTRRSLVLGGCSKAAEFPVGK